MAEEKEPGQEAGGGTATADKSVLENAVSKARERREETVPFQVISEKSLPQSSREVVVEVPREEWNRRLEELFKEARPSMAMEGFRKGKVPMKLLQRRFTREASVQLIEQLTPNIVREYEQQKQATLYGSPAVPDFNTDGDGPVQLTIHLEVKPEIEPKDYAGVEVEVPEFKMTDEMVNNRIEELRQQNASFEEAADRALQPGDAVVVDIQGVDAKGHTVLQEANKLYDNPHGDLPHEVAHAILGKKAGETVEVKDKGPEGQPDVRYTVTVKSVKELKVPELDDEFAKDLGHESMEAMRQSVREQLQKMVDSTNSDEAFERLVEKLIDKHEFEVPPALKAHVERDMARQDYLYMSRTGMTPPRLQGLASRAEYQEELDKAAEQRVKGFLLLDAIGLKENITVEEADLNAALEERAQQEGRKAVAVRAGLERRKELAQFAEQVRFNKIREVLLSKTNIKYVEPKEETPEGEAPNASPENENKPAE